MKLSVLDLVPVFPGSSPQQALEQAVLLAQTAESLGYNRYWVAEHHDMEILACSSPEIILSHIGAKTSRIRLGSGAVLLPHYKPVKVAETFNLLATLYPGRIDLGLGRAPGGSAHVSIALSGNFLENIRQLPDTLSVLMKLLANEYELDGQPIMARPIPPVSPEIWMLGTNHKSASYAAEFGTGYVFGHYMSEQNGVEVLRAYRQQFKPSKACSEPSAIVAVSVICADTEAEAVQLAAQSAALFQPHREQQPQQAPVNPQAEEVRSQTNRKVVVGNPGQVRAQLLELREKYEVDEFVVINSIPDYKKRLRSFELLASAVL